MLAILTTGRHAHQVLYFSSLHLPTLCFDNSYPFASTLAETLLPDQTLIVPTQY